MSEHRENESASKIVSSDLNKTAVPHRLSSFKTPRDLSLSGTKLSKKVFTPNLNATRNKNKGQAPNIRDQVKDQGRARRDRNKNVRNGPQIIKSSGVFSEGLGTAADRHRERLSYGRSRFDDSPSELPKPTLRVKDLWKVDKEVEEKKKNLGGIIDSDDLPDGDHDDDSKDAPVKLPLLETGRYAISVGRLNGTKVKLEEKPVKQEPFEENYYGSVKPGWIGCPKVKTETDARDEIDLATLLRGDKSALILLQLPDSLPGHGGSGVDDERSHRNKTSKHTAEATTSTNATDNNSSRCVPSGLEEGLMGKLLVRRSGRVQLALGDALFDVCSGSRASFRQEAVSVAVNEEHRSANIISLGPIEHRFNVTPDWETMLKDVIV